jgi:predicted permease
LLKSPRFVLVVVFSLAVGMGVNTAVFTVLDSLVLKAAPLPQTEGLVFLSNSSPAQRYGNSSYPGYRAYAEQNDVFSGLMAYTARPLALTTAEGTEEVSGEVVSANYFSVLQVNPAAGRLFLGPESGSSNAEPVAVLSHDFWKRRYGSDPTLVGQTVIVNGHSLMVVGITSSQFTGLGWPVKTDIWVPVEMWATTVREPERITGWGHTWIEVMGRLKPTVAREQAEAAMTAIAQGLPRQPGSDQSAVTRVILSDASDGHPGAKSEMLGVALPAAGSGFLVGTLVLLIGCANAANLLVARAASRRKEIAIRMALGSSRVRLVRLLLMESLVLASLAGIAGFVLASWGIDVLLRIEPPIAMPELSIDLSPDLRVFGFTLVLSLVTGTLFGLAPALRATGTSLTAGLNEHRAVIGRGAARFTIRNILVVSQVAMSLLLLITAGLFARSLQNAVYTDPGFDTSNVYLLSLASDQFGLNIAKPERFDEQVLERVRSVPGIESATLVDPVPLSFGGKYAYFEIAGRSNPDGTPVSQRMGHTHIAPDYFNTLRIPLVRGRDFADQDSKSGPAVAIINETAAARLWPNQDPLGERIIEDKQAIEIVGIARDTKHRNLGEQSEPWLYIPILQNTTSNRLSPTLLVRSGSERSVVAAALRREISLLAPNWPAFEVKSMTESTEIQFFLPQLAAAILGGLGIVGLLLAIVGIYGLVSYSVAQRTREIGIRMALGARSPDVMKLVITQSITLTLAGILIGGAIAAGVTRFLSSLLIGISPTDPITFAVVTVSLVAAALVACIIPARRALKVDPNEALRYE